MVHVLLSIALLSLVSLPLRVQAASSPPVPRKNNQAVATHQEIVINAQGIHIQVKERLLQEVLEQIHQMSGVHFSLSQAMKKIPVTAILGAPDWPTAIRQLLRSFNTFEVWEKNGNDLLQVFVLTKKPEGSPMAPVPPLRLPPPPPPPPPPL